MSSLIHRISEILGSIGVEHRLYGERLLVEAEVGGQKYGVVIEVEPPLLRVVGLTDVRPGCDEALRLLSDNFEARGRRFALDPDGYLAVVVEEPLEKLSQRLLGEMLGRVEEGVSRIIALGGGSVVH